MCEKTFQKILMQSSLLATEQHLEHFNWPLTYFSITDCVGSLFLGHAVHKVRYQHMSLLMSLLIAEAWLKDFAYDYPILTVSADLHHAVDVLCFRFFIFITAAMLQALQSCLTDSLCIDFFCFSVQFS